MDSRVTRSLGLLVGYMQIWPAPAMIALAFRLRFASTRSGKNIQVALNYAYDPLDE